MAAIEKSLTNFDEKESVKAASASGPVKRTRAPRSKPEPATATPNAEKEAVKEASPAPVKRKRAPRQPKPAAANEETPAATTNAETDQ